MIERVFLFGVKKLMSVFKMDCFIVLPVRIMVWSERRLL